MGDDAFHSISFQPLPVKRKLKQQSEAAKDKVPHDVRQRYVNMFTEEFLKTTADVNEAFEKVNIQPSLLFTDTILSIYYDSSWCLLMAGPDGGEECVQSQREQTEIPEHCSERPQETQEPKRYC